MQDYRDHSPKADQEIKEVYDETRARGVNKRTFDNKIAEVSTSKSKKRAKKAPAESTEPAVVQNLFDDPFKRSEDYLKQSRLEQAARNVADGKITLEELDKALHNAVTERNVRLADQGAFYDVSKPQRQDGSGKTRGRFGLALLVICLTYLYPSADLY